MMPLWSGLLRSRLLRFAVRLPPQAILLLILLVWGGAEAAAAKVRRKPADPLSNGRG